jgi:hypothetical protein
MVVLAGKGKGGWESQFKRCFFFFVALLLFETSSDSQFLPISHSNYILELTRQPKARVF